jgi:DNA-binding HxlR family transcriptional regulator
MARYRGYGQVCPLAKAAELLCERWTLLVVRELCLGSRRYAELRRGVPMISPSVLSQRLRELEDGGVIQRIRPHGAPKKGTGSAEYDLTPAGRDLAGVLEQMAAWGHRWAVADLRREDMEPSYLMWVAHRSIRTEEMGPGRIAVAYHLLDAPGNQRLWWIVIDDGEAELCFKHPGFAVSLTVALTLRTMSLLLLGKLCPKEAARRGLVRVDGSPELRRAFPKWYPRSFEFERTD